MLNDRERACGQRGICKAALMRQIQELGFAVIETRMYLDMYDSTDAAEYLNEKSDALAKACAMYEREYGPLTISAGADGWTKTPWPWESEAN